jgi:hypothetical protein
MLPEQNETQPQFAIRFHGAMQETITDPYERNAACDEAWESGRGEMVERALARDYFDPDKYSESRDVVVFCEHVVPDSATANGTKITGNYDSYSLAAMCDNMNGRIRDTDQFSPIAKGHTAKGAVEPDLLGYSGAMRLGMVGREKPKFAVLTDEYRRNDKLEEFRSLPGRSPEVWKYPAMGDRFFAPVAALGVTTPRLDLPPAKYSAIDADGNETPIDRYSRSIDETSFDEIEIDLYMSAMGADNGFTPSMGGRDNYGGDGGDGGMPDFNEAGSQEQFLKNVVDGLMQTQQMQWVTQQMQQSGGNGMASPAVQQPVDVVDQLPGQQPAAPPQPGGMPPDSDSSFPGGPPPDPAQRPEQGQYAMTDHYAKPSERVATLEAQNAALNRRLAALELDSMLDKYSRELDVLGQTHVLNPATELDHLCSLEPEAATAHLARIKDNYQRNLTGIEDFPVHRADGEAAPNLDGDLDEQTADAISKYAMEHEVEYTVAREQYQRQAASTA